MQGKPRETTGVDMTTGPVGTIVLARVMATGLETETGTGGLPTAREIETEVTPSTPTYPPTQKLGVRLRGGIDLATDTLPTHEIIDPTRGTFTTMAAGPCVGTIGTTATAGGLDLDLDLERGDEAGKIGRAITYYLINPEKVTPA